MGQYIAEVANLGPLVDTTHALQALKSIYRYNYKRQFYEHENVQRTLRPQLTRPLSWICDYGQGKRPEIPFPYFAEVFTGVEYQAAAHMIYAGMVREGVECIENIRRRYDGERRNPWDEAECGHHYARAMAAWSGVLALSGFHYHGVEKNASIAPRINVPKFSCFWSAGTGWGTFTHAAEGGRRRVTLAVAEGNPWLSTVTLAPGAAGTSSVTLAGRAVKHELKRSDSALAFAFGEDVTLHAGDEVVLVA